MVYRGPAKIRNLHISVLYLFCKVKFKFNVMLVSVLWISVSKQIRRYMSRNIRVFSSRDEFLGVIAIGKYIIQKLNLGK